jgi:hypothetical protein
MESFTSTKGSHSAFACQACSTGRYQPLPHMQGAASCELCPVNTIQPKSGSTQCIACEHGKYTKGPGSIECKRCPTALEAVYSLISSVASIPPHTPSAAHPSGALVCEKRLSAATGPSITSSMCAARSYFKRSRRFDQPQCIPCSPGRYQPLPGQTSCLRCPPMTKQEARGSDHCQACPMSKAQLLQLQHSPALHDLHHGMVHCPPTPQPTPAKVVPKTPAPTHATAMPTQLPTVQHTHIPTPRPTVATLWTSCDSDEVLACVHVPKEECASCIFRANDRSLDCQQRYTIGQICGQMMHDPSRWVAAAAAKKERKKGGRSTDANHCGAGSFKSLDGLSGAWACLECSPGRYQPLEDQAGCTECRAPALTDMLRTRCASAAATAVAATTTAGTHSSTPATGGNCRTGRYGKQVWASGFGYSTVCADCPLGRYQPGQSNGGACIKCRRGFAAPHPKSNICGWCTPGRYQDRVGAIECKRCQPNTYQQSNGKTSCVLCAEGRTSSSGADACTEIDASNVQGSSGPRVGVSATRRSEYDDHHYNRPLPPLSEHTLCPKGAYALVPTVPNSRYVCVMCPSGKFQRLPNQHGCVTCPRGMYQPASGAHSCNLCPVGTYSPGLGEAAACKLCPHGLYAAFIRPSDLEAMQGGKAIASATGLARPAQIMAALNDATGLGALVVGERSVRQRLMTGCAAPQTAIPTHVPTPHPTTVPTPQPSTPPVAMPTPVPSASPSSTPPPLPTTLTPSMWPTSAPTPSPTNVPNGCTAGKYGATVAFLMGTVCQNCAAGKYQNEANGPTCKICPAGKQQLQQGQGFCHLISKATAVAARIAATPHQQQQVSSPPKPATASTALIQKSGSSSSSCRCGHCSSEYICKCQPDEVLHKCAILRPFGAPAYRNLPPARVVAADPCAASCSNPQPWLSEACKHHRSAVASKVGGGLECAKLCECPRGTMRMPAVVDKNGGVGTCAELALVCPAGCRKGRFRWTAPAPTRRRLLTSCMACPNGKFQAVQGAAICYQCPSGKYQPGLAAASCIDCPRSSPSSKSRGHCVTEVEATAVAEAESSGKAAVVTEGKRRSSCVGFSCPKGYVLKQQLATTCPAETIAVPSSSKGRGNSGGRRRVLEFVIPKTNLSNECCAEPVEGKGCLRAEVLDTSLLWRWIQPPYLFGGGHRNIQPSAQACRRQCLEFSACMLGTYFPATRSCWLATSTGGGGRKCETSAKPGQHACVSFRKMPMPTLPPTPANPTPPTLHATPIPPIAPILGIGKKN